MDLNTGEALSENLFLEYETVSLVLWLFLYVLNSLDEIVQHSESVRNCISKPDFVFIILESVLERHLIPCSTKDKKAKLTYNHLH